MVLNGYVGIVKKETLGSVTVLEQTLTIEEYGAKIESKQLPSPNPQSRQHKLLYRQLRLGVALPTPV